MELQQHKGLSFAVPQGWSDRTVIAFAAPPSAPGGYLPNMVIARERIEAGDTLQTHADRTLLDMAAQLPEFELVDRFAWNVDGRRAVRARCTWKNGSEILEQDVTICDSPPEPQDPPSSLHVVVITLSTSASVAAQQRHLFDAMVQSVRFDASRAGPVSGMRPAYALPAEAPLSTVPLFGMNRR